MRKQLFFALFALLLMAVGMSSCKHNDFDPADFVSSVLSGEYKNGGAWKLYVTVNGAAVDNYDYVRMMADVDMKKADFKFVDVIPGESKKEFKDVPLADGTDGLSFTIEYAQSGRNVKIDGTVTFGKMDVNITL